MWRKNAVRVAPSPVALAKLFKYCDHTHCIHWCPVWSCPLRLLIITQAFQPRKTSFDNAFNREGRNYRCSGQSWLELGFRGHVPILKSVPIMVSAVSRHILSGSGFYRLCCLELSSNHVECPERSDLVPIVQIFRQVSCYLTNTPADNVPLTR